MLVTHKDEKQAGVCGNYSFVEGVFIELTFSCEPQDLKTEWLVHLVLALVSPSHR
jgi:hypothetical protein